MVAIKYLFMHLLLLIFIAWLHGFLFVQQLFKTSYKHDKLKSW